MHCAYHFTGKERDAESGNDYFGARYYNSATGRWLSPDWSATEEPVPYAKLDNPQSLNLYGYVGNNPVTLSDSDGHTTWKQYLLRAKDRAESALDAAGQKITGTAEFSIRDPDDRADALHTILGAANTAASVIVPAIATDGLSLDEEGAALATADAAQAEGRTSGTAAALRVGNQTFTDVSTGGAARELHPDVRRALDNVPAAERSPFHGECAEPGCISQAREAGVDPQGGKAAAVKIRKPGNSGHGAPKAPCTTCANLNKQFGIDQ